MKNVYFNISKTSLSLFMIIIPVFLFTACEKESTIPPTVMGNTYQILHLAHPRMPQNEVFNPQINTISYSDYDVLLLGGDLALETTADLSVLDSLDAIFNLSHPSTLLALGNHDYPNINIIETYTKRPAYYTYHYQGITYLILDTQDQQTNFTGEQLELIQQVTDTMKVSSHLFLVSHKLAWLYDEGALQSIADDISNGPIGDCFYCINPNNFYQDIYPLLTPLTDKGIEVYCVGGDLGIKQKTFYHHTEEGIHFIASGLNNDDNDNMVILFDYNLEDRTIDWRFEFITEL